MRQSYEEERDREIVVKESSWIGREEYQPLTAVMQ